MFNRMIKGKKWNLVDPVLLITLFLVLFAYILTNPLRMNDNAALLLKSGELLFDGYLPYVDFIELDPPMIMYLDAIPVAISRALSINQILVFSLLVAFFSLWSLLSVRKTLVDSRLNFSKSDIYSLMFFYVFFILWVLRVDEWGQREYLFTLTFIPFLTLRFVRSEGGAVSASRAVLIGLITGIFTVLKQHFLFIVFFPELYTICKRRSIKQLFSLEYLLLFSVCVLYAFHFFFIPSEMRDAFFYRWVPSLINYYNVYEHSFLYVLDKPEFYISLLLGVLFLGSIKFYKTKIADFVPMLFFALIGSFGMYLLQSKGFRYHLFPGIGALSLMVGIFFNEIMQKANFLVNAMIKCVLCLFAISCMLYNFHPLPKKNLLEMQETINRYTQEKERVLIISTTVYHSYPLLVQMNRELGSRYTTTFPLSFFSKGIYQGENVQYRSWEQLSPLETQFIEELLSDIQTYHPPLILIKNSDGCQGCPLNFNIYQYLQKIGFIDKLLHDYKPQASIQDFAVFTLIHNNKESQ